MALLERHVAAGSDDCAHGSVMSASQSQLLSPKPSTTALARGRRWWRGARGRRERCTRRTTAYGHRRHLSRGRGQHHCLWLLGRRVCGPELLGSRAVWCRRWSRQLWRPRRRRRLALVASGPASTGTGGGDQGHSSDLVHTLLRRAARRSLVPGQGCGGEGG